MTKIVPQDENRAKPRVVALVYDGLCTFEFGIVSEVFGLHRPEVGGHLYDFKSVCLEPQPVRAAGGLMVTATGTPDDLAAADIIVVPGWRGVDVPVPDDVIAAIRAGHDRGARLISICSGAFVLASSGVLADRRATTHWRYEDAFNAQFPDISMEAGALYVDEGDIITSAGSSAGIDACLHVIRTDYGSKIANTVARRLVIHSHRQGSQAQFIKQPVPKGGAGHRLSQLMDDLRASLTAPHTIASMATLAGMSPRTFQRQFISLVGMPAVQWLTKERIARACTLLETTDMAMDDIAAEVGFGTAETMRYHFRRGLELGPAEYRKRFLSADDLSTRAS